MFRKIMLGICLVSSAILVQASQQDPSAPSTPRDQVRRLAPVGTPPAPIKANRPKCMKPPFGSGDTDRTVRF